MNVPPPLPEGVRGRLLQALSRVDAFAQRLEQAHADQLVCGSGCDDCCRQVLHLRGVEAAYLLEGSRGLSREAVSLIWGSLEALDEICPLLHGGVCLAYESRPTICRTHGLPLLRCEVGEAIVHHCPRNFHDLDPRTISRSLILDEERVVLLMDAVDGLYCRETGWAGERIDVRALLRIGLMP